MDLHVCFNDCRDFFLLLSNRFQRFCFHPPALPSPVMNWICTSVYSLDRNLTMTCSGRNELFEKHLPSAIPRSEADCQARPRWCRGKEILSFAIAFPVEFSSLAKNVQAGLYGGVDKLISEGLCVCWFCESSVSPSVHDLKKFFFPLYFESRSYRRAEGRRRESQANALFSADAPTWGLIS